MLKMFLQFCIPIIFPWLQKVGKTVNFQKFFSIAFLSLVDTCQKIKKDMPTFLIFQNTALRTPKPYRIPKEKKSIPTQPIVQYM